MNADRVGRLWTVDGAYRGFHTVGDGEGVTVDVSARSWAPAIAHEFSNAPAHP